MGTSTVQTLVNFSATILSAGAAVISVIFAVKTYRQNQASQVPILEMFFRDTSNPHEVKIGIKNIGSGLAKEIKGKINPINFEMGFGSDLLPMRFGDTNTILTWDVSIPFDEGKNPLFHDGEVVLTYKDIWGKSYSTKMSVKSDVDSTRAANGHLDKNPSGTFYQIR